MTSFGLRGYCPLSKDSAVCWLVGKDASPSPTNKQNAWEQGFYHDNRTLESNKN